jgi:hypothetical protein
MPCYAQTPVARWQSIDPRDFTPNRRMGMCLDAPQLWHAAGGLDTPEPLASAEPLAMLPCAISSPGLLTCSSAAAGGFGHKSTVQNVSFQHSAAQQGAPLTEVLASLILWPASCAAQGHSRCTPSHGVLLAALARPGRPHQRSHWQFRRMRSHLFSTTTLFAILVCGRPSGAPR